MIKVFQTVLLALYFIMVAVNAADQYVQDETLIVINDDRGAYREIVQELQKLSSTAKHYRIFSLSDKDDLIEPVRHAQSIVTIGTRAAEAVYQLRPSAPILSTLITRNGFEFLSDDIYGSVKEATNNNVSALFLDQPVKRLVSLGQLLLTETKRAGIITSDFSALKTLANKGSQGTADIDIIYANINNENKPISELATLIKRSDFTVVLPGKKAISISAAKWILQIGLNARTPIIAYSNKYVQAGALAAVYASPHNIAAEINKIMGHPNYLQKPAQLYANKEFTVSINKRVAKHLNIEIMPAKNYQRKLQQLKTNE